KLLLLREGLRLRRAQPALFLEGDYQPLAADGALQRHVVAFTRAHERRRLICAVPRLCLTLLDRAQPWEGRLLVPEGGTWVHLVPGRSLAARDGAIPLRELFADFPVALLRSAE